MRKLVSSVLHRGGYFWLAYHNLRVEKIYSPACFLSFPSWSFAQIVAFAQKVGTLHKKSAVLFVARMCGYADACEIQTNFPSGACHRPAAGQSVIQMLPAAIAAYDTE
jgi:hypothetical protein